MEHWNRMPDALKKQVFKHLSRLAAKAHLTLEDRLAYDRAVDRYNINRLAEEASWQEAKEEGREEGRKEGRKEERLKMARQFKLNGVPTDVIAQNTGLSTRGDRQAIVCSEYRWEYTEI